LAFALSMGWFLMKDGVKHEKIRYLLFGYQIVHGKIIENPPEKELVEEIYQKYLQGWSIKQLALYAEQSGIPYRENSNGWNKNMVTRILEDERYWNGENIRQL
jgi:hypothetical protein